MKHFIKENKGLAIYSFLIVFATYGIKLFNNTYAIDTMHLMTNYRGYLKHWVSIGRPGLVALKLLTYNYVNVYFLNLLAIIFFAIATILLCYYVDLSTKQIYNKKYLYIIPSIFPTSQLFSEQFYFVLQNFEFSLGICLVRLSLIAIYHIPNKIFKLFGFLLLTFTLTMYQSFFVFACTLILFKILMTLYFAQLNDLKISFKDYAFKIGHFILLAISSLVLSQLMAMLAKKVLNVESSYLDNMILWGKRPLIDSINDIKDYAKELFFPTVGDTFFTPLFLICVLLLVIVLINMSYLKRKNVFFIFITLLGILITPLMFTILGGKRPAIRGEVPNFPAVLALLLIFIMIYWGYNFVLKHLLVGIVILFTFIQVRETTNLEYSEYLTAEEDLRTAEMITNNIYSMEIENPESYKLLMYGNRSPRNVSNIKGETNGVSLFEFMPNSVHTSLNTLLYMKTFGLNFNDPTPEDFEKHKALQAEMNVWPSKDSIRVVDDCIVVNLSK
ncbi:glucosyltransferase domain-containing protein [Enterococcus faecalis]|nr:glucosyltransferase domain-containing protein [Enterococcus faecalis]